MLVYIVVVFVILCFDPNFFVLLSIVVLSIHQKVNFFKFNTKFLVQHECIPQAILGMDIVCQAKSGMGKTAVFVLATLQQLQPEDGVISVLVMCHTRELAFQISKEYERFSKYMPGAKVIILNYLIYFFCRLAYFLVVFRSRKTRKC